MTSPAAGAHRASRSAALGGVSVGLAALAHVLGGGALPTATGLALLAVPVGLVALLLTSRRLRFPLLLGVLGMEQLLLHQALSALAGVGFCGSLPMGGMHHASVVTAMCDPGASGSMTRMGSSSMVFAHLVATVAVAAALAHGEALVWRAVDTVAGTARLLRAGRLPRRVALAALSGSGSRRLRPRLSWCPASPRGPPAAGLAA